MGRRKVERDPKGKFLEGNQVATRSGEQGKRLPLRIQRQGQAVREGLIRDLGPTEECLTCAQIVIIDKAVSLFQVSCAIESYIRENGAIRGDRIDPMLGEHYISYCNALRLMLRELGIEKKQQNQILAPYEIVEEENGHNKRVK